MKRILSAAVLSLAVLSTLPAAGLFGFGLAYDLDRVDGTVLFTPTVTTLSGFGFSADVYVGQRLGLYAAGSFGLVTGASDKFGDATAVERDMAYTESETFFDGLLGLGAFLPRKGFDLSAALGFGVAGYSYRYASDLLEPVSRLVAGPGGSVSLGVPVSRGVEAALGCRALYGLVQLGDEEAGFKSYLSITPFVGVRMKF